MDSIVGLTAVVMGLGIPLGAMYTYYRVRKLRSEERLAAISRGVGIPTEAEISPAQRSRRTAVLLVSGAVGYMIAFALIAQIEREPETLVAAALGVIPLAIGLGYFVDWTMLRRDARTTG